MNKKTFKKLFLTIGSLMLLTIVITMSLSAYVAWQLTHPDRLQVTEFPEAYDLPYMEVQFMSRVDNVRLEGWLIPADTPTDEIVIQAHGYMDNRSNISAALPVAKGLHKAGIAVLMFDFRGHGNSSGELVSGGLYEVRDLLGAVDYARTQKFNQIGLL